MWRDDGKELMLFGLDRAVSSVEVSAAPTFHAAAPRPMFRAPVRGPFFPTGDLKHFLFAIPTEDRDKPQPITVILNWEAALKK